MASYERTTADVTNTVRGWDVIQPGACASLDASNEKSIAFVQQAANGASINPVYKIEHEGFAYTSVKSFCVDLTKGFYATGGGQDWRYNHTKLCPEGWKVVDASASLYLPGDSRATYVTTTIDLNTSRQSLAYAPRAPLGGARDPTTTDVLAGLANAAEKNYNSVDPKTRSECESLRKYLNDIRRSPGTWPAGFYGKERARTESFVVNCRAKNIWID